MKRLILVIALLLIPVVSFAAGSSTTVTTTNLTDSTWQLTWSWTADDTDGTVPTSASPTFYGFIYQCETNPGSTAPTDDYDITLVDSGGADVMGGVLLNRDTSNTELAWPTNTPYVYGAVTFTLTNNSVNSATGTLNCVVLR